MKISILGGANGSFSHIAANNICKQILNIENPDILGKANFRNIFDSVNKGETELGLIPVENSTYGSVYENYDLLASNNLNIVGEIYLKINFHLLGLEGSSIESCKSLYTHKVSIMQISKFLEEHSEIEVVPWGNNGDAAKFVSKTGDSQNMAAASMLAANLYNLKVIQPNIHNNPKNYTRFFLISKDKSVATNNETNKTTIMFEVENTAGSLVKVLNQFALAGISMSKIESRPIIGTDWEYAFYIDLETSTQDPVLTSCLSSLEPFLRQLKVLGSYQKGIYVDT